MSYIVAKDVAGGSMDVPAESQFSKYIHSIFKERRPRKIVETGTYRGQGTTKIILSAIKQAGIENAKFITIECNPSHWERAVKNCKDQPVQCLLGLSLARASLPTREQIHADYVVGQIEGATYVDGYPEERASNYFRETDYPDEPDNLLGKVLNDFEGRPDFVLLDSAGHLGWLEFQFAIDKGITGPCIIALDDTKHVKHSRSVQKMKSDSRFKILVESDEKFGFAIAEFTPK